MRVLLVPVVRRLVLDGAFVGLDQVGFGLRSDHSTLIVVADERAQCLERGELRQCHELDTVGDLAAENLAADEAVDCAELGESVSRRKAS
jgi:hypothetical protein